MNATQDRTSHDPVLRYAECGKLVCAVCRNLVAGRWVERWEEGRH